MCYARSKVSFETVRNMLPLTSEARARYSNPDNDPRGDWQSVALTAQSGHGTPSQFYTITTPSGRRIDPPSGNCWRVTEARLQELVNENRIWFGADGNNVPRHKLFLSEQEEGLTPHTLWQADEVGTTDSAKRELNELFGGETVFDTPKPVKLLKRIIHISSDDTDICFDFFAGSGTTAQAVLETNQEDGGSRKFVLVQLPEPIENNTYPTISEITKERVRRVIKKMNDQEADQLSMNGKKDRGFRVFKLAESNFKAWDASTSKDSKTLEKQLELHIEHLRKGRTSDDILYELLLKSGFPLTTPVKKVDWLASLFTAWQMEAC